MRYRDELIDDAVDKLETQGIVPLDEIFGLVEQGINFRELDDKYNKHNRTYVDRPSRSEQQRLQL